MPVLPSSSIISTHHRRTQGGWWGASSGPTLGTLPIAVLIGFGSVLAVIAAISNSPVVIGVLGGVIFGGFLFAVPRTAFWLCVLGAMLVSGAVSLFAPQLNKLSWLFSMLGFFLLIASLFRRWTTPQVTPAPAFVWLALLFIGYALLVSPLAGATAGEVIAGAKRYFQFWGLLFAGAWLLREPRDFARLFKLLAVVAALQLPLALYQRIVLVPMRNGLGNGVVPIDVVSGTFEATMLGGGNSSAMVLFLTVAAVVLVSAWREGAIGFGRFLFALVWVLVPMGLGETKVMVVFLPIVLLVLFGQYVRRAPMASISILVVGMALTGLLFWIYGTYFGKPGWSLAQRLQATLDYNFGEVGYYGAYSLNRTTAITYWWRHHGANNPLLLVFGHGLGSSYAAPTALVQGHVAAAHRFIGIGFSAGSSLLWDLGLLGLTMYVAVLAAAWRTASMLLRFACAVWWRAALTGIRCAIALFTLMVVYSDSLLNALSVQCLLMLCLGALAHCHRSWREGAPTWLAATDDRRSQAWKLTPPTAKPA